MNSLEALGGVAFGDLTDIAMSTLDSAVGAIRVETTFGPPIYIPSPFRKDAEVSRAGAGTPTVVKGEGFDVARMLKPKITFEMRQGWGSNKVFAPYGDPGPSKWGFVVVGLLGIIALASYGGVNVVRNIRRK